MKSNKRRIILLIFLLSLIIFMIAAFTGSTANKVLDVTAVIVDYDKLLGEDTANLQAINEGQAGYSITLPKSINGKIISSYVFVEPTEETDGIPQDVEEPKQEGPTV